MNIDLPDHLMTKLRQHHDRCHAKAEQISRNYGSIAAFRDSLKIEMITEIDDPVLREFYRLYETVFTLEDEREPIEGFIEVLGFNKDKKIQAEYGPFHEPIIVMRDPRTNDIVGAANFVLYAYPGQSEVYGFDASCQLHFILVREDLRGLGLANDLLDSMETELATFADCHCGGSRSFITCEQNNPSRMTEEQIVDDAVAALIDPCDRMQWWRRRGFRRLDFAYVQPPLSAAQSPCEYLDYFARIVNEETSPPDSLPSSVLIEHLRRFFFVSVDKFVTDIDVNAQWRSIQDSLSRRDRVALI